MGKKVVKNYLILRNKIDLTFINVVYYPVSICWTKKIFNSIWSLSQFVMASQIKHKEHDFFYIFCVTHSQAPHIKSNVVCSHIRISTLCIYNRTYTSTTSLTNLSIFMGHNSEGRLQLMCNVISRHIPFLVCPQWMHQWCSTKLYYMCYCILWTRNYWVSSYNRPHIVIRV